MLVYTQADDKLIERNRPGRWKVFLGIAVLSPLAGILGGTALGNIFLSGTPAPFIAGTVGGLLGFVIFLALKTSRMTVINDTTGAFVTIDTLRSVLNLGNINVMYGPGTHISYPWEQRYEQNNIPVIEATNEFSFTVKCKDGVLVGKGSYRLRPDPKNPVRFLSGVAAVADDLKDLIIAHVASEMVEGSIMTATKQIGPLNTSLESRFVHYDDDTYMEAVREIASEDPSLQTLIDTDPGAILPRNRTTFEHRFGVQVGDVTIKEMLPSEEVQKTISALTEAKVISKGTAILLGMTEKGVKEARNNGTLPAADYNLARDRFMAASGNLEGVEVTRYEVMLNASGIDKDTASALSDMFRSVPPEALAAVAASASGTNKPKKGGRK